MVFPVPHCTWAMLCKSPCACVSQWRVQQISSGINTSRFAGVLSWDPFTEARDSHWLMEKKWIKHFTHSAHCEREFAWVPRTSESNDTAFLWLFFLCVSCLLFIVSESVRQIGHSMIEQWDLKTSRNNTHFCRGGCFYAMSVIKTKYSDLPLHQSFPLAVYCR